MSAVIQPGPENNTNFNIDNSMHGSVYILLTSTIMRLLYLFLFFVHANIGADKTTPLEENVSHVSNSKAVVELWQTEKYRNDGVGVAIKQS